MADKVNDVSFLLGELKSKTEVICGRTQKMQKDIEALKEDRDIREGIAREAKKNAKVSGALSGGGLVAIFEIIKYAFR